MRLDFVTVDVFTELQFGGNPLAVIADARGLSTNQMQKIAAEFNLSETAFVLPPKSSEHTAEVRIFTPRAELPFAGHPTVGTAFVLGRAIGPSDRSDIFLFEEKAGLVRVQLLREGASVVGARLAAPQPFAIHHEISPEIIAAACSLGTDDIETAHHQPCVAACGTPVVIAELKNRSALSAAEPRADVFARHLPAAMTAGVYLYMQAVDESADIQARMFGPLHGIPEDPATGGAGVVLIGLLAHLQHQPEMDLSKRIGQGADMGRPSLLEALAQKRGGAVTATFIGGRCAPMMEGTLNLH